MQRSADAVCTSAVLIGTNFGNDLNTPVITVGSRSCIPSIVTHTNISCVLQSGSGCACLSAVVDCLPWREGVNRLVTVTVKGVSTLQSVFFNYSAPVIQAVSPNPGETPARHTLRAHCVLTIAGSRASQPRPRVT